MFEERARASNRSGVACKLRTGSTAKAGEMIKRLAIAASVLIAISATAEAANIYGSIAYSPSTDIDGYSYNYPNNGAAQQRALKYCRAQAADCKVVVNFHNACGALAVGDGTGWGAAWVAGRRAAENKALANCGAYTTNCYVKRWVCSGN
jgi:hypothetical protein